MRSTLVTTPGRLDLPATTDLNPFVDTTLDLSINSFRHLENQPKGEIAGDNINREGKRERSAAKQEGVVSVEELNRIMLENKKVTELLTMCIAMQSQMLEMKSPGNRKRKFEEYEWDNVIRITENSANSDEEMYQRAQESTRTKVFRVCVPVDPSDMSLIVKDGYHWRKYGQKVTRDNPSPRAYYKCSFAPNCPVKKKVQRSVDNPSLLVATYEGQHNHRCPTQTSILSPNSSGTSQGGYVNKPVTEHIPRSPVVAGLRPSTHNNSAVLDMVEPPGLTSPASKPPVQEAHNEAVSLMLDHFPQFLVQQMASSLSRDPNFRAALAEAMSGRNLDQELPESW